MLTRGKIHNVSDGANCQDSEDKEEDDEEIMNDDNSSEKDSSSSKDRQSECKVPFRPRSALQMKRTPSADRANMSPVLVRKHFQ